MLKKRDNSQNGRKYSKRYKELLQLNYKKTTQLKNKQKIWIGISLQVANKHMKRCITSNNGNANQSYHEIPPYVQQDGYSQKDNYRWW